VLFASVFLWQFPHFMAIAWMYRDDYDRAGYRVLPRGEERAPFVVLQTLLPLWGLVFASLVPLVGQTAYTHAIAVLVLGFAFLHCGVRFAHERSGRTARHLLFASIVYLPSLFVLMMVAMPRLGG
jgi:heme o synthase